VSECKERNKDEAYFCRWLLLQGIAANFWRWTNLFGFFSILFVSWGLSLMIHLCFTSLILSFLPSIFCKEIFPDQYSKLFGLSISFVTNFEGINGFLLNVAWLSYYKKPYRNSFFFFFTWTSSNYPTAGVERYNCILSHSVTHHSWYESSGRGIGLSQFPVPDNTQNPDKRYIFIPSRDSNPQSQ
jgi:hypothetical protein